MFYEGHLASSRNNLKLWRTKNKLYMLGKMKQTHKACPASAELMVQLICRALSSCALGRLALEETLWKGFSP